MKLSFLPAVQGLTRATEAVTMSARQQYTNMYHSYEPVHAATVAGVSSASDTPSRHTTLGPSAPAGVQHVCQPLQESSRRHPGHHARRCLLSRKCNSPRDHQTAENSALLKWNHVLSCFGSSVELYSYTAYER